MAGNCIIDVDSVYLAGLIGVLSQYHSEEALEYRIQYHTGTKKVDTNIFSLFELECLSDMIYYLGLYDVTDDNCVNVHKIKQAAMKLCEFNESDISDKTFTNSILGEDGEPILLESGTEYLILE